MSTTRFCCAVLVPRVRGDFSEAFLGRHGVWRSYLPTRCVWDCHSTDGIRICGRFDTSFFSGVSLALLQPVTVFGPMQQFARGPPGLQLRDIRKLLVLLQVLAEATEVLREGPALCI